MDNNTMEKRYGLPTAISMVIGIVIGSGVFIKGGKVLALTNGNMLQGVLVVALVGIICIICSLVFAELGSKFEKVNGVVDYAEVALGENYAYYVGWFMTTIYYPCLAAMLAFFSAVFFCELCGIPAMDFFVTGTVSSEALGLGAGFLMIGYGINILSPKLAGKLQVSTRNTPPPRRASPRFRACSRAWRPLPSPMRAGSSRPRSTPSSETPSAICRSR